MTSTTHPTTLVLAASGKTGRRILEPVLEGVVALPVDGVQRALGRAPRDFADYARRAAATGVWESGR